MALFIIETWEKKYPEKILHKHRVEKLLVVDDAFNLKGLITVKADDIARYDAATGTMDLELTGDSTEIERAIAGLRKKGVIVDPIELNVVE